MILRQDLNMYYFYILTPKIINQLLNKFQKQHQKALNQVQKHN